MCICRSSRQASDTAATGPGTTTFVERICSVGTQAAAGTGCITMSSHFCQGQGEPERWHGMVLVWLGYAYARNAGDGRCKVTGDLFSAPSFLCLRSHHMDAWADARHGAQAIDSSPPPSERDQCTVHRPLALVALQACIVVVDALTRHVLDRSGGGVRCTSCLPTCREGFRTRGRTGRIGGGHALTRAATRGFDSIGKTLARTRTGQP